MKQQIIKRAEAYYSDWALNDSTRTLPEMMADFVFLVKTEKRPNLNAHEVTLMAEQIIQQIKVAENIGYADFCKQVYGSDGIINNLKSYRIELPDNEETFRIDQLIIEAEKEAELKLMKLI